MQSLRYPLLLLMGFACFGASACANPFMRAERPSTDVVRGQQPGTPDDGSVPKDGNAGSKWLDRITGRGAASNVPIAENLPWIGDSQPNEKAARALYIQGDDAFRKGKYDAARESYKSAAAKFPDSPLHEDSLFMIAECDFFSDQYPNAFTAYEELVAKYKRSRHLDTVVARQFAIGQYWMELYTADPTWFLTPNLTDKKRPTIDLLGRARRAFEKVRLNNPTGKIADDSLMATASSYFTSGRFSDADYYFTLLRREYPDSDHQYQAHVLGIQAKLRRYQGTDYDGTPLDEALELANQSLKQFPKAPVEERQRLGTIRAEVIAAKAQRDFETAQYFEHQGYNAAARFYYEQVAADYPDTQFAAQARERLPEVAKLPANPPERFRLISQLFPEEQKNSLQIRTATAASSNDTTRQ